MNWNHFKLKNKEQEQFIIACLARLNGFCGKHEKVKPILTISNKGEIEIKFSLIYKYDRILDGSYKTIAKYLTDELYKTMDEGIEE